MNKAAIFALNILKLGTILLIQTILSEHQRKTSTFTKEQILKGYTLHDKSYP